MKSEHTKRENFEVVAVYNGETIKTVEAHDLITARVRAVQLVEMMRKKEPRTDAFVEIRSMGDDDDFESVVNWWPDDIWKGCETMAKNLVTAEESRPVTLTVMYERVEKTTSIKKYNHVWCPGERDGETSAHWVPITALKPHGMCLACKEHGWNLLFLDE